MASKRHRGVKFLRLADGRVVVRWRDPVTRKQVQRDCAPLGLTRADLRRRWAVAKAAELAKLRGAIALGSGVAALVTIEKSQSDYVATFANENTSKTKASPLADLAEYLAQQGAKSVQDITPPMLAAWGNHVRRPANPHIVGTRNLHLAVAGAWLRWARELGQLPRCTPENIKAALKRQKAAREPIEVLRPQQVRDVLRSCIAHDEAEREQVAPLALLLLLTGMRYAEGAELLWGEVDLEAKAIRLPAARVKTKAARTVTLAECPTVLELLGALRLRGGGNGRVFGIKRTVAEKLRLRTISDYKAPTWDWRTLRRTCGSAIACAGVLGPGSPFLAAKRAGHSVAIAERHYLGVYSDLPRDATTIEQALGIEAEAKAILRSVAGVRSETLRVAR